MSKPGQSFARLSPSFFLFDFSYYSLFITLVFLYESIEMCLDLVVKSLK